MYNTSVNIIASIPNINIIINVLEDYSKGKTLTDIKQFLVDENIYGIRTLGSRKRFYAGIETTFIQFKNEDHKNIISTIFSNEFSLETKNFMTYMQMAINNRLFFLLTKDILIDLLFKGRLNIDKELFVAYISDLRKNNPETVKWTDETIHTTASKYLTLMKKFHFLKGSQKKEFNNFFPSDEMIIMAVYLIKSLQLKYSTFINNPYSQLMMMSEDALIARLRIISMQEYFTISAIGKDLKIELKYDYKEIGDVIRKNN